MTASPGPRRIQPLTFPELFCLPTAVDLRTAAHAVGISLTTAYRLVHADRFPCRILRLGHQYRVPTACLMKVLGIESIPVSVDDVSQGAAWAERSR